MYNGDPHKVSAREAVCKCLANPKSAIFNEKCGGEEMDVCFASSGIPNWAGSFNSSNGIDPVNNKFCGLMSR